nr:reverse transcriptase domain-containing protein [Tanacetum cinerariifolium]
MANTTPIVTTVTKAVNKEKTPKEANAALEVNILDFFHARLDFEESPKKSQRVREGSQNSSAGTLPASDCNPSKRPMMRDGLRYNDGNMFDRLGHRRQSVFNRLSDTYSPSTTKSGPDRANFKDHSHSKGRPHRRDSSPSRDRPRSRDRLRGIEESYGNTCSSHRTGARHRYHSRNRDRSHSMKRGRESESLLSRVSKSGTSDEGHWKSNSKRRKPTGEEDLAVPWLCEEVEHWAKPTWCHMFNYTLIGTARVWFDELSTESIDGYNDLKAALLTYFMQQKKYVKDPVEIHNIKQRDGETIKDFMKRFKVKTGRMKMAPECMRIFRFMHGVNKPELTKGLNEHVPKTMEEMMTATTAFIPGETAAASKKKGHTSWKPQDQPKWYVSEQRSNFQGPPREGQRGTLSMKEQTELCSLLKEYLNIFAWQPPDMTGVPRSVAEHRLNIRERYLPVRQKKRGQALKRARAIQVETAESDKEKMAFYTSHIVYCYTKMPFGIKNAGAIYQRLVDKAFDSQVGWNIEVYVDDLVIKSHTKTEMLRDIDETFCTLRKINIKLNPKKCTFGEVEGMFLGYMISPKGIKPCPEAALRLPTPRTIKEKCIKKSDFYWTPEAEQAFKQLKQHLLELPMLGYGLDASLFRKPRTAGSQAKLYPNGKASPSTGFRRQKPNTDKPGGNEVYLRAKVLFTASNNEAKYEALIAGLRIVVQTGVRNVHVSIDSKLAANQVLRTYVAKEENMIKYLEKAKSLVLVEVLKEKSIQEKEVATVVEEDGPTWMTPIVEYLKDGTLPDDRKKKPPTAADSHHGSMAIIQVGIDIAGPFPEGPGKVKFLLVDMDYFTKWIEAKSMVIITDSHVQKFVWDNIVCRFGVPREIVSDNEIKIPMYRIAVVDAMHNDEELRLNLDLLEESRERVAIREAKAKLKMTKYYNARVRGVTFRPGDFVYRSNDASHAVDGWKL